MGVNVLFWLWFGAGRWLSLGCHSLTSPPEGVPCVALRLGSLRRDPSATLDKDRTRRGDRCQAGVCSATGRGPIWTGVTATATVTVIVTGAIRTRHDTARHDTPDQTVPYIGPGWRLRCGCACEEDVQSKGKIGNGQRSGCQSASGRGAEIQREPVEGRAGQGEAGQSRYGMMQGRRRNGMVGRIVRATLALTARRS